jgi:hypothetical protein
MIIDPYTALPADLLVSAEFLKQRPTIKGCFNTAFMGDRSLLAALSVAYYESFNHVRLDWGLVCIMLHSFASLVISMFRLF